MKDKVTMEGYIEELETKIAKLGLQKPVSDYDKYLLDQELSASSMILDTLNANSEDDFMAQEEQNILMACRNCQNPEMCDYCSFGGNMPPMGV